MKTLAPLHLDTTPLEGRNLIEASAGTGKTYTIAALYLRLVVEEKLSVDRILVVTFTEAATQELAERIRLRLRDALAVVEGAELDDPLYNALFPKGEDRSEAAERLRTALRNFDEAAIFTIHGFCRRLLTDHAFESGSPLDMELVTDLSFLKLRAVEDFYRRMVEGASPLYAAWLKARHILPESLASFLSFSTPLSRIAFLPEGEAVDPAGLEAQLQETLGRCRCIWEEEGERALAILAGDSALNRNKYRKGVEVKAGAAARNLFAGSIPFGDTKDLEKLSLSTLNAATKKGKAVEENPLFQAMDGVMETLDELKEMFERNHIAHLISLARYVDAATTEEKERAGIMGFDDLLSRVAQALTGVRGEELARGVGKNYDAALIDEFQDTDPEQYEIFDRLFSETTLFMIGDPKQAIYGFRGADIFAYLRAAGEAEKGYTLGVNYRSTQGVVQAVNTLFSRGSSPFLFDRIQFAPVASIGGEGEETLTLDGVPVSPLVIQRFEAGEKKPLSKEAAQNLCTDLCGAEMVHLLRLGREGRVLMGKDPLTEKDVAVIVRTNDQARIVKNHLTALGVHAVLYSSGNVFDSDEADEIALLLAGCLKPWRLSVVKAALGTCMIGLDADSIRALGDGASQVEYWSLLFAELHALWREEGFMPMMRRFTRERGVYERLVGLTDGERRVTNMQHVTGLLHREAVSRRLTPEGLVRWLSRMQDPASLRLDEHQLQLESDRTAVQIVTIHKSKGLEYGVVFFPFPFMGYRQFKGGALFHKDESQLVFDAGSDDFQDHVALAEGEALAEELRLLYVALTRARYHMVIPWGRVNGWERSAMARLLHAPESRSAQEASEVVVSLGDAEVANHLRDLETASDAIRVDLCEQEEPSSLAFQEHVQGLTPARKFQGRLPVPRVVTSFSGLASAGKETGEADYDAWIHKKTEEDIPAEGIYAFPKGATPGTFMHTLFENIAFDADAETLKNDCYEMTSRHGYDAEEWNGPISGMVSQVLSTPLEALGTSFTLSEVPANNRLHEMEFTFPLKRITPGALKEVLNKWGYGTLEGGELFMEGLAFSPVQGFLKGFIDLIFQIGEGFGIVDWKSNHLGNSPERYHKEALAHAMGDHHYGLQYLLYTVALNRHLTLKLGDRYDYDTHMAGSWYIFLRGVDGSGNGVYFDRPDEGCIQELDALLIDAG